MTLRERYRRILLDKDPNVRTIKWEFGYWGATINHWYETGMPKQYPALIESKVTTPTSSLNLPCWLCNNKYLKPGQYAGGFTHVAGALSWPTQGFSLDREVKEYFKMDDTQQLVDVNFLFYPMFDVKIEEDTDDALIYWDIDGVKKIFNKKTGVLPTPLDYPVYDWDSWNKIKAERLNPLDIKKRFPENWKEKIREYRFRDYPLGVGGLPFGVFGTLAHIMGYENLFCAYYEEPELVHDIISTFTDLWIEIISEILKDVEIDFIQFWEDISGTYGPMVSPNTMREFMVPYYKRITDFGRAHGIPLFIVDTDGDCNQIIPVFLDGGINVMYPFEVHAGMDVLKVRTQYPGLACTGGINKMAVLEGPKKIDELLAHVRETLKVGGYIPHGDHFIPPEVDFDSFCYYRNRLNEIIDEMGRE